MQVHDNVQTGVAGPADDAIEILEAAPWIILAALDEVFFNPEPDGDAYGVQPVAGDLVYVALGDPGLPVLLESGICGFLAKSFDAGPFVVVPLTSHASPLILSEPFFYDEQRT